MSHWPLLNYPFMNYVNICFTHSNPERSCQKLFENNITNNGDYNTIEMRAFCNFYCPTKFAKINKSNLFCLSSITTKLFRER